jgi:hypothetical protein
VFSTVFTIFYNIRPIFCNSFAGNPFYQIGFLSRKVFLIHENPIRWCILLKTLFVPFLEDLVGHPSKIKNKKKSFSKFSACETRLDSVFQGFFLHFFHGHLFLQTQSPFFKKEKGNFQAIRRHLGLSSKTLRKCKNIEC